MNRKYFLLIILGLISLNFLFSQDWINYNTQNTSFPTNPYRVIETDIQGNKWIGTQFKGVYKYDGTNWEIYNTQNSLIPSNQINDLKTDIHNNIWICTSNGGLAVLSENQVWTIYNKNNSDLPVNDINTVCFDNFDNKWIGTKNGLVLLDADDNWYIFNSQNTPIIDNDILSIAIEKVGDQYIKWIGTANSLYRYDDWNNQWTRYSTSNSSLTGNTITSIHIDNKKNKWLAVYNRNTNSGGGLVKIDSMLVWTAYTTQNSNIPSNYIYDIDTDTNDPLLPVWVASDNGIAKLSGTSWTLYNMENTQGLITSNQIYSIKIQGLYKWIGTEKMMVRLTGTSWVSFSFMNSGIPSNKVNTILSKKINNRYIRWIGTSMGLSYFDGDNWTVYHVANSLLPSNNISALTLDNYGNLWIGTKPYQNVGGGLARFNINDDSWTVYNTINSELPSNTVTSLLTDKNQNIWIGTEGGGLVKISNQSEWTLYNENNSSLSSNVIIDINYDNLDKIWIATDYGISILNTLINTWTVYNKFNSPLPGNLIKRINFSPDYKQVWISSNSGLIKKQDSNWLVYTTENSQLPVNNINDAKADSSGFIWIATANGLIKTDEFNWQIYNTSNSSLTDNNIQMIVLEYLNKNTTDKFLASNNQGLFVFKGGNALLNKGLYLNILQHPFLTDILHIYAYTNRINADSVSLSINNQKAELTQLSSQQWYHQYNVSESTSLTMKFRAIGIGIDTTLTKTMSVNILRNTNQTAYSHDNQFKLMALEPTDQNILIQKSDTFYELNYSKSHLSHYRIQISNNDDYDISVFSENHWVEIDGKQLNNHSFLNPTLIQLKKKTIQLPFISSSNYPNPFNPSTLIKVNIDSPKENAIVKVTIYNLRGQFVKELYNQETKEKSFLLEWNGKDKNDKPVSSGIYFYTIQYNHIKSTNKMLLLK